MSTRSKALGLLLSVVFVAGCVGAPLRTAPAAVGVCMDALLVGELVTSDRSGLGVRAADGTLVEILWPFGYSARREGPTVVLLDERGAVVARQGDMIEMGGGLGADVWEACAGSIKVTAAPIDEPG